MPFSRNVTPNFVTYILLSFRYANTNPENGLPTKENVIPSNAVSVNSIPKLHDVNEIGNSTYIRDLELKSNLEMNVKHFPLKSQKGSEKLLVQTNY